MNQPLKRITQALFLGSLLAGTAYGATGVEQKAFNVAKSIVKNQKLGGTVSVFAVWTGVEQDNFLKALKPFTDATGIKVEYEATRDINAVLTTRVQGGNAPDVAVVPSISLLQEWAEAGKLIDLDGIVGTSTLERNFGAGFLDLGGYKNKTYGLFVNADVKGLVWYNARTYKGPKNPKNWDELAAWTSKTAASGTAPWCLGVESGAASGWVGTDWIENILLRQSGPKVYDQWYQGKLPWTSAEVKAAFQTFGKVAGDAKMVYGGSPNVLSTNFGDAATPMFGNNPRCFLHHQASFIPSFFEKNTPGVKAITDYNFFSFPDINPQYAGTIEVSGDMLGVFRKTPQTTALIKYLATPEAQAIWPSLGGKLSPNKRVPLSVLPNKLAVGFQKTLNGAKSVRFDASDLMPDQMNKAFWKSILDYVQNPSRLDQILGELEQTRKAAY
ncbi:ABC transporter substrate-binding protein [Deinococcus cellulosilyticus]|uniref:ABC transporter substrate-binding protein n=1 Tax=Deinococcus cellulosilyticus (strain DSM 18568 / NBRC 106333 / KACC 11606 / 5516J-15) TaxID=1223518 RepID=A0A511N1A7_DEIC1|nr:extracellular solute-binding protein [Deinococcus cellulosilyticus]GEM46257.1 ABC transporter substrate-binding protein [Deinococcus cellulosilyticus NBRC 106333 = KACC 11606]